MLMYVYFIYVFSIYVSLHLSPDVMFLVSHTVSVFRIWCSAAGGSSIKSNIQLFLLIHGLSPNVLNHCLLSDDRFMYHKL